MKQDDRWESCKAGITVFISLILMCLFTLFCVLVESARTAGARWYLQMAADSALDSVFSQYHRPLWDAYRLLFAEYESEEELLQDFSAFVEPYLETENWYPIRYEAAQTDERLTALDGNGAYFEKEVLDYMKYGIWKLDFEGDLAEEVLKCGKEAEAVKNIAESYRGHAAQALHLEKALEAISENLAQQLDAKQDGISCLRDYDADGFRNHAKELIRLLKKIPKLVDIYEKRADVLAKELEKSRENCAKEREHCSEAVDAMLEEEIRQYESYVSLDGERRKEVQELTELSENYILRVQEVMEEAEEVEEIIEDWDDEDDEEPDLEGLWNPVIRHFEAIVIPSLSFSHGVKDKEKEGLLNQVERMYRDGMLTLLLPDGAEVSEQYTRLTEEFPSRAEQISAGSRSISILDHLMVNEYCGAFFSCFTDGDISAEGEQKEHALQYEMEYLLQGSERDEENLTGALQQLLAIREGLNLIHIMSDSAKRAEARQIALAITGLAGITPLVMVTTFFVMSVWALGESIMDVKGLLAGKKVPVIKTSADWTLEIEDLLNMGSSCDAGNGGGETGISYLSWLKVLLFLDEIVLQEQRMMDVIQMNLRLGQSSFCMNHLLYETRIKGEFCGKHIFFSIPFVDKLAGNGAHTYSMSVTAERVY